MNKLPTSNNKKSNKIKIDCKVFNFNPESNVKYPLCPTAARNQSSFLSNYKIPRSFALFICLFLFLSFFLLRCRLKLSPFLLITFSQLHTFISSFKGCSAIHKNYLSALAFQYIFAYSKINLLNHSFFDSFISLFSSLKNLFESRSRQC
jgi:hypothetical protein